MPLLGLAGWEGRIFSGGWVEAAANVEAFTETQWVTIRSEIAPYPF